MLGYEVTSVEARGTLGSVAFDGNSLFFTADHPDSDAGHPDNRQETFFMVRGANGQQALVEVTIHGDNDPIIAMDDVLAIGEGQTSANLYDSLMANDQDLDYNFLSQRILAVNSANALGTVQFDFAAKTLTYTAPEGLAEGETITDSFTYLVGDGYGSTDTATVTVTVTGGADGGASVSLMQAALAFEEPISMAPMLSAFLAAGGAEGADPVLGGIPILQPDMLFMQDLPIL
jgi:VCBS repeat-containing protein